MRAAHAQPSLERALQLAIATVILLMVLSAGAIIGWISVARKLRWAALLALVALAVAYAWRRGQLPSARTLYVATVAFLALAALSTAWSSFPRLTLGRLAALALIFVAGGALGAGAQGRTESIRRLLDGVLGGTVAVAVGGLLVLLFDHSRAVQPATSAMAERYQGLGGGPDTATMVLAVGVPTAAYAALRTRRRSARAVAAAGFLLLLGSIVASGSRGALAGAFAGLLAFAVVAADGPRRKVLAAVAVTALLIVAAAITRLPKPHPGAPPLPSASPESNMPTKPVSPKRYVYPVPPPNLQDDIGRPPFGVGETTRKPRTLFGTSGRAQAWQGALDLGRERPLLGFGFGTEDHVFVDRYADFNSNTIENSYIGVFLELGLAGIGIFLVLIATVAARTVRAARRLRPEQRHVAAACAGATVAGLVLALFQSYIYAPGNNATAAVWICFFLLVAATAIAEVGHAGA